MWDVTRADWGAGPHRAAAISTPVAGLVLHHSVTPAWRGAAAARNLRQIALGRGMVDISYSGLADTGGVSIEGRGWGRQGAHTRGHNTSKHAVCAVGNFDTAPMPQAMVNGIARICRNHRRYGPARITHGHRDLGSTACPGRHAYGRIGAINTAASGSPSTPPPSSPPPPPGGLFMSLSKSEEREVLTAARYVNYNKPPSATALVHLLVHTLSPDHEGHTVRAGDLNERVLAQLKMVIEEYVPGSVRETLREELAQLLAQGDDTG